MAGGNSVATGLKIQSRPLEDCMKLSEGKGVATIDWILRFPTSRIHHLDVFHSDHKPMLLCLYLELKRFYCKGRPFYFEARWLKDNTCEGVIIVKIIFKPSDT
ncbi:hypothetical protein CFP56_031278 [Quercus suber]|uniref:Uncharacterized protein n=1 Tax=Quercus suber TaxID=58331 RepID=A0AAW0JKM1_QUESU